LAAQTLVMTLHGSSQFALTFCCWLLIELTSAQLSQQTSLFYRTLETAHGHFKRLVFLNTYSRHEQNTLQQKIKGAILPKPPLPHNLNLTSNQNHITNEQATLTNQVDYNNNVGMFMDTN